MKIAGPVDIRVNLLSDAPCLFSASEIDFSWNWPKSSNCRECMSIMLAKSVISQACGEFFSLVYISKKTGPNQSQE